MGLNAFVYCDCFQQGRVRVPAPVVVTVAADGSVEPAAGSSLDEQKLFDGWRQTACEHPGGIYLSRRLGNVDLIGAVRGTLERTPNLYPVLLTRVVHSGSHSGDSLGVEFFDQLSTELDDIVHAQTPDAGEFDRLRSFVTNVRDVLEAGRHVNQPIVF